MTYYCCWHSQTPVKFSFYCCKMCWKGLLGIAKDLYALVERPARSGPVALVAVCPISGVRNHTIEPRNLICWDILSCCYSRPRTGQAQLKSCSQPWYIWHQEPVLLQWNLSVTTTPKIKFIPCDLFSNVVNEEWRYQFTLANNFCLLELI